MSNLQQKKNIYGAFELKRIYARNYFIGVVTAIAIHLFLVVLCGLFNPKEKINEEFKHYKIVTYVELGPPPSIVRDNFSDVPSTVSPKFGKLKIAKKGEVTSEFEVPKESSEAPSNVKVEEHKPAEKKVIPVDETYYVAVDIMPEPFGGMEALQKNVTYPEQARKENIVGKVFVKAFINENGEVTRAEIVKGLGYGCDEEALWVVKSTRFKPAKKNGKTVKVQLTIGISFRPS